MLRVVYSNRTEELLASFLRDLQQREPLEPALVLVPNRNVETYLRFGTAQALGIAANLEITFVRRYLGELLERSGLGQLAEGNRLLGLVLARLLDDEFLAHPELGPVRDYLQGGGSARRVLDVRRVQLAEQVARLFEEYAYSRLELLQQWPRTAQLGDTPFAEAERWQRRLWLSIFGARGLAEQPHRFGQLLSPTQLLGALGQASLQLPRRVQVFGVSYVARLFQSVWAQLSQRCELVVYTLNPCQEFWEDVQDERSRARLPKRAARAGAQALEGEDPFSLDEPTDAPALRLWGRPGRENIRLLNELTGCDFEPAFADPLRDGDSLLRRVQRDILDRAPLASLEPGPVVRKPGTRRRAIARSTAQLELLLPPAPPASSPALAQEHGASFGGRAPARADGSLQLLRCAGVRREAEAVAEGIWSLIAADSPRPGEPRLRFNEIAVLVCPKERDLYLPHLAAAFSEAHAIPHNVVELPLSSASRVAEAALMLLELPLGSFARAELLPFLTHPCTLALGHEPGSGAADDGEERALWVERLGIALGAEKRDLRGTYLEAEEQDLFTWDQGLRRLALGALLAGERSGERRAVELGGVHYLPEELSPEAHLRAAGFARLVRSLIADLEFVRTAELPLAAWAELLAMLVEQYVGARTEQESRELARLGRALRGLGELAVEERPVSFTVARELAVRALGELSTGRGQHLADGVVISTLQPMRSIPFRAIFVVGLGEGRFPSPEQRSQLDLRAARPRAGDVTPRQQDRYAFLETLLCARDRLTLSYVGRDPLTGEEIEPSSVVLELLDLLRKGYLGEGVEQLVVQQPLRRFDEASHAQLALPPIFPEARAEALAQRIREQQLAQTQAAPQLEQLRANPPLAARFGLVPLGASSSLASSRTIHLSLSALRKFLECPLQGHATVRLGLQEEELEDTAQVSDEPVETPWLEGLMLMRAAFVSWAGAGSAPRPATLEDALELQLGALRRRSLGPVGLFGRAESTRLLAVLETWAGLLGPWLGRGPLQIIRFGRAAEGLGPLELLPALELEIELGGARRRVLLHGQSEPLLLGLNGALLLDDRPLKSKREERLRRTRSAMRAFLGQAALAALGQRLGPHRCLLAVSQADELRPIELAAISQLDARAWLGQLVTDLFAQPHSYLLPCEAIFSMASEGQGCAEAVAQRFEHNNLCSSRYGSVPHPERYPVPSDEAAQAILERRYRPFLARLGAI